MNYNNRKFKAEVNSSNGEVDGDLIFLYHQKDGIVTCTYQGEHIQIGHLVGLVDDEGIIEMSYHQVNTKGELRTGVCTSKPEVLENGKIRLHEEWQWTTGDLSKGHSVLIEI